MLITIRFYDGTAIYTSHGLRNCQMLIYIYLFAFFIFALISLIIRSNDKVKNIFICEPPIVFIQVSRPMFSTLRNLLNIIFTYYYPSGCYKSNMAVVYKNINSKIIITRQILNIHSFMCLDTCFQL